MSNIDKRIVEMQFENSQFEKGVRQSMKSIEDLEDKLQFEKAEEGIKNLQKAGDSFSLDRMAKGVEAIGEKFTALGIIGKRVLENLTDTAMRMGESFVRSISVDQISAGFDKYEMKTRSVKTIMEATGRDVEYVNGQLEQLNRFTDETSYNYGDMVSNIGKFTSMGIDLDTSITAMEGIATWAALSGQGVNEASRAMYNLSQAIGVGQVKLMDWKSIENANMATKEFKQTAIDTAKSLGLINSQGKTAKGTLVTFENFSQTLAEGWFTKDVLIKTLDEYGSAASQIIEYMDTHEIYSVSKAIEEMGLDLNSLGVRAFLAAQEARTFKDSIDATKDAVSTGWMKTFEYIFGNVEEATELWTEFTEVLYEVFAAGGESRNRLLKDWSSQEIGGRADLIRGLMDVLWALVAIINTVKDAFSEIFPPITVEILQDISLKVKEFGANLRKAFEPVEILTDEFEELRRVIPANPFEAFDKSLKRGDKNDAVKQMQERLIELGYNLDKFGADGIFGPETQAALEAFQRDAGLTVDGVYDEATHKALGKALGFTDEDTEIIETVQKKIEQLPPKAQRLKTILKGALAIVSIGAKIVKFLGGVISRIADALSPIAEMFGKIAEATAKFFIALNERLNKSDRFQKWLDNLSNILGPVKERIQALCDGFLQLLGIGGNLEDIDFDKVVDNLIQSIKNFFGIDIDASNIAEGIDSKNIVETIKTKLTEIYTGVRDWIVGLFSNGQNGEGSSDSSVLPNFDLYNIAIGGIMLVIGILSSKLLSAIGVVVKAGKGVNKIIKNVNGILSGFKLETQFKGIAQVADALLKFAFAIGVIAASIWVLSQLSWDQIAVGLVGLAVIMVVLAGGLFLMKKAAEKFKNIDTVMNSLLILALSIGILGLVVTMLAQLSWEQLRKGLIGIAVLLGMSLLAIHVLSKQKVDTKEVGGTIGLIGALAFNLSALVGVIKALGSMDPKTLIQGFIGMAAVMLAVALFMKAAGKIKVEWSTVAGLVATALALDLVIAGFLVLAFAMKVLNPSDIIKAVIGMISIALTIAMLMALINKIDPSVKAILALIPVALALDLVIVGFIALAFAMKAMTVSDILKAVAGFAIIIGAIAGLLSVSKAIKPSITGILALIPIALALDLVIIGFVTLAFAMKAITWNDILKVIAGFAIIVVAIAGMLAITKNIKPSIKGIVGLIPIVLAMNIAIIGFIALALAMKAVTWDDLLKTIVAFGVIAVSLAVLSATMSATTNLKGALGMIIAMIAMAGAMVAFAVVLNYVKNVSTKKILGFAEGLSEIMLSFGALAVLSKAAGLKGILLAAGSILAISAAVGLVIAAFGALNKIPGFQDFMKGGAATIGQIIGTIIEEIEAAKFKGMAKGMEALSSADYNIDKDKLNEILDIANAFSEFNSSLPDRPMVEKLIPWAKTNMDLTMLDMISFANGITAFAEGMKKFNVEDYDSVKIEEAEQMVSDFADFNSNLPEKSTADRIVSWVTGQSNLDTQLADMQSFAKGIAEFAKAMPLVTAGLDGYNSEDMAKAEEIVTDFANFNANLPQESTADRIVSWVTGQSNLDTQLSGMQSFAKGIAEFAMYMPLVTAGLDGYNSEDMAKAEEIVTDFANFNANLPQESTVDRIVSWVTGQSNLDTQLSGMQSFANGIAEFAKAMPLVTAGLDGYNSEDMAKAEEIVTDFANFNANLPQESTVDRIVSWVTGQSNLDTQLSGMQSFANGIIEFAKAMPLISSGVDNYVDEDMTKAMKIVTDFANFSTNLPSGSIGDRLLKWVGIGSNLDSTMYDMDSFASGFNRFSLAMSGITWSDKLETDTNNAIKIATNVATFLADLNKLSIDKKAGAVKAWFTDETSQDTVFDAIAALGESMINNVDSFKGLSEGSFVDDIKAATKAAMYVAGLLNYISGDDFKITKDVDQGWNGYTSTFDILVANISTIGDKIQEFAAKTEGIDLNSISSVITAVTGFLDLLVKGTPEVGSSGILSFLNTEDASAKIASVVTAVSESFSNAGIDLASAFSTGMSTAEITGGADMAKAQLTAVNGYAESFKTAGKNFAVGLANGVTFKTSVAVEAAKWIAINMLNQVRIVFNSHSPSKETTELGKYFTEGLAIGTTKKAGEAEDAASKVANSMLSTASGTLTSLSELLADDIDVNPVISPVVDLTDAKASAALVGGLFGNRSMQVTSNVLANSAMSSTNNGRPVTIQNGTLNTTESLGGITNQLSEIASGLSSKNSMSEMSDRSYLAEKFGDLADAVTNLKIVLDTGTLVGELAPAMDTSLGDLSFIRERGN